jgi:hypothetical protein
MAYQNLMNAIIIPDDFASNHKEFGAMIGNTLLFNIECNIDNDHPFRRFALADRNQSVRNIEESTTNNNMFGEQMLIDYFRSNSIYHEWLQNLLDHYVNYSVELGFSPV